MPEIPIIDIYWDGPFKSALEVNEYVTTDERGQNTDYFFYQIYGDHVSYGNGILLYIGMSENEKGGIVSRLNNHNDNWIGGLCSEAKIYIGSYGYFKGWGYWHDKKNNSYYKNLNVMVVTLRYTQKFLKLKHY
ncbi:hypothetical protein [Providencia sp.]|uniref:hypothetical protein n=1 Tax=Providencia sp. TaxID=589 RepID=UPI0033411AD0